MSTREMCAEMATEDLNLALRYALLLEHGCELPMSSEAHRRPWLLCKHFRKAALLAVKNGIAGGPLLRGFVDEGCTMVIARPKRASARSNDHLGASGGSRYGSHEQPNAASDRVAFFVKPIEKVAHVIGCKAGLNFHSASHHGVPYRMIENYGPLWLARVSRRVLQTLVRSLRRSA